MRKHHVTVMLCEVTITTHYVTMIFFRKYHADAFSYYDASQSNLDGTSSHYDALQSNHDDALSNCNTSQGIHEDTSSHYDVS